MGQGQRVPPETAAPPDRVRYSLRAWELERSQLVSSPKLSDQYGRNITHLRISLTDRCHFRCIYCMPPEGIDCLPRKNFLSADEIKRLVRIFCGLGINKIRLTGGEPLLRPDVLLIADKISRLKGVHELTLTTNGSRLKELAKPLKESGVSRLNISLDSLNKATFEKMSLSGGFHDVMDGILKALHVGFEVKVNVVVMKGINDHEIPDFIEFALNNPIKEIRFIEFMPLCGTGWKPQYVLPLGPWIKQIQNYYGGTPVGNAKDSVSESFDLAIGSKTGRVGFITTMSRPFCNHCSRIRITADGVLRPCLFSSHGRPLRELLRAGADDGTIATAIREAVFKKPKGNRMDLFNREGQSFESYMQQNADLIRENPFIRSIGG